MKNGTFTTIVNDQLNDLIITKHPNTFQNQNCMNRRFQWSVIGVVHYTFLKSNHRITAEFYYQQLDEMYDQLSKIWQTLVNWSLILFCVNAQPHVARMTLQKLTDLGHQTLSHPLYSLDLPPTKYCFFKNLDTFFCQKLFCSKREVENAYKDFLGSKLVKCLSYKYKWPC